MLREMDILTYCYAQENCDDVLLRKSNASNIDRHTCPKVKRHFREEGRPEDEMSFTRHQIRIKGLGDGSRSLQYVLIEFTIRCGTPGSLMREREEVGRPLWVASN